MRKPDNVVLHSDAEAVEELLAQAKPRTAPPAEYERMVRAAVREEWCSVSGARRFRQRLLRFAVAASVLLALAAGFYTLRQTGVAPVDVAAVTRSFGPVYVGDEGSELHLLPVSATFVVGETIVTGSDAGIGIDWYRGGSLRLDEDTAVEFLSAESIFLRQGRVYFDSGSEGTNPVLSIDTAHGELAHVGTQYMAAVDTLRLVVSVREGRVEISRRSGHDTAIAGQRLEFVGNGRPVVSNISATGTQWTWVEMTAPTPDFSGKSTYDFVQWVGRQTGYGVVFESPEAERLAKAGRLVGTIQGLDPRAELEVRMLGEDLDYSFDETTGTLRISARESGG